MNTLRIYNIVCPSVMAFLICWVYVRSINIDIIYNCVIITYVYKIITIMSIICIII